MTATLFTNGTHAVPPGTKLLGEIITWSCSGVSVRHLDLVNALQSGQQPTDIPNIWVKQHARPKLRNPIEPLDAIPFLARDMLDERWGESPYAVVVPEPGAAPDRDELLAWANQRLASASRLAGLELRDALPRSADMEKVLKRELRAPFWTGRTVDVA